MHVDLHRLHASLDLLRLWENNRLWWDMRYESQSSNQYPPQDTGAHSNIISGRLELSGMDHCGKTTTRLIDVSVQKNIDTTKRNAQN